MSAVPSNRELAKTSELSQELRIGLGEAMASVRTLSAVSLTVHARELVVLSGSRGAGERALLAVLAGDRRGVTGVCTIAQGVRARLLRISAPAALALAQEWQRAETAYDVGSNAVCPTPWHAALSPQQPHQPVADLFLLDVVPEDARDPHSPSASRIYASRGAEPPAVPRPWNEKNRSALSSWVAVCRHRGGAVVMAAGERLGRELFDVALGQVGPIASGPWARPATVREGGIAASSVRVVAMHCGRLAAPVRLPSRDRPT